MSKLIKIDAGKYHFLFVCSSRNTRHGFAHDCRLFVNDRYYGKHSCYYLNRTWESWNYQSACIGIIRSEIEEREKELRYDYMESHNYSRMTSKRKEEFASLLANDEIIALYKSVENTLKTNLY